MSHLQVIIDIEKITKTNNLPLDYLHLIGLHVALKDGATAPEDGYSIVRTLAEAQNLTDQEGLDLIFNAGYQQVVLLFDATKGSEINDYCFTLLDFVGADVIGFKGAYWKLATEFSDDLKSFISKDGCGAILYTDVKKFPIPFINDLLTSNTWSNNQYKAYDDKPVYTSNADINKAFEEGYTYVSADGISVVTPRLYNAKLGNLPMADFYIQENLIFDIQKDTFNWIANNNPSYSDIDIANMELVGQNVVDRYINQGLILGGTYIIPRRADQSNEDISLGIIKNLGLKSSPKGAVWRVSGTARSE